MQYGVLLQTLRHLINRVRTQGVEEGRSVRGDVRGDNDTVLGHRVDVGREALESAHASATGEVSIEEDLGHSG